MTTLVGTQSDFHEALYALCELDYDAKEAYEAAINRLEDGEYKKKLTQFKEDHQQHIDGISRLLQSHQKPYPQGPSAKCLLTQGKVIIADLVSDKAILLAMKSNEEDTNTAYDKVRQHKAMWPEANALILQGLADEKRHKAWLEAHL